VEGAEGNEHHERREPRGSRPRKEEARSRERKAQAQRDAREQAAGLVPLGERERQGAHDEAGEPAGVAEGRLQPPIAGAEEDL
jgi:hypothetical protein